ncbi:MAG: hypothetical protein LBD57_03985 [Endomicrobium sp.]|jgi:hypothetical protein|uniref:hypothetical protein n=1 Tax=Candidatus Endomicrobiellum cubanum TaxID=3242325 RepID=UPI00282E2ED9|nr:hypothetical protein [Endomicrobium sp.]
MSKVTSKILLVFAFGILLGICINFSFLYFISITSSLIALFIYTLKDAAGLKYNQDKYFISVSIVVYTASLIFSLISITTIILFIGYELLTNNKSMQQANKQLFSFYLIIVFIFIGKMIIR